MAVALSDQILKLIDTLIFTSEEEVLLQTFKIIVFQSSAAVNEIHTELLKLNTDYYEYPKNVLDAINKNLVSLKGYGSTLTALRSSFENATQTSVLAQTESNTKIANLKLKNDEIKRNIETKENEIVDSKKSIDEAEKMKSMKEADVSKNQNALRQALILAGLTHDFGTVLSLQQIIQSMFNSIQELQNKVNSLQESLNSKQENLKKLESEQASTEKELTRVMADLENEKQKPEVFRQVTAFGIACISALDHFQYPIDRVTSLYEVRNGMKFITDEQVLRENKKFLAELKPRLAEATKTHPVFQLKSAVLLRNLEYLLHLHSKL